MLRDGHCESSPRSFAASSQPGRARARPNDAAPGRIDELIIIARAGDCA